MDSSQEMVGPVPLDIVFSLQGLWDGSVSLLTESLGMQTRQINPYGSRAQDFSLTATRQGPLQGPSDVQ